VGFNYSSSATKLSAMGRAELCGMEVLWLLLVLTSATSEAGRKQSWLRKQGSMVAVELVMQRGNQRQFEGAE